MYDHYNDIKAKLMKLNVAIKRNISYVENKLMKEVEINEMIIKEITEEIRVMKGRN